jgi:hypothetical protein
MPQQNQKPIPPLQLLIPLDPQRLRGMSSTERGQVVTCLAALLLEGIEDIGIEKERTDDCR